MTGGNSQRHPRRSQAAFIQLMGAWMGSLVSAGYLLYHAWHGLRQSCVAHVIRTAQGLAEKINAGLARVGRRVPAELQRLCHMGTERPSAGQRRAWYARFDAFVPQPSPREAKAGTFARRLQRDGESLGTCLDGHGVEATHNIAERAYRFGVMWRQRSQGTGSEKSHRGVERVLSLRHTCRMRGQPAFPILVEAVTCLCKGKVTELRWINRQESLPACSTP